MKKTSLIILFALMLILPRYAHADITTGLVGWWKFADLSGTTAADSSGNGVTGNLTGNIGFYVGNNCALSSYPGCLIVNTSSPGGYVDMGSNYNFTSGDFTLSEWTFLDSYTTTSGGNGPIIFYKGQYETDGYYVQIGQTGGVGFQSNQSGAVQQVVTSAGAIPLSVWTLVTVVRSGSTVNIYINGLLSKTGTISNPTSSSDDFQIATYNSGSILTEADWYMQDARVYDRALSQSDVTQLYYYPNPVPGTSFFNELKVALGKSLSIRLGHSFTVK